MGGQALVLNLGCGGAGQDKLGGIEHHLYPGFEDPAVVIGACRIIGPDGYRALQIHRPAIDSVVGPKDRYAALGLSVDELPVYRRPPAVTRQHRRMEADRAQAGTVKNGGRDYLCDEGEHAQVGRVRCGLGQGILSLV